MTYLCGKIILQRARNETSECMIITTIERVEQRWLAVHSCWEQLLSQSPGTFPRPFCVWLAPCVQWNMTASDMCYFWIDVVKKSLPCLFPSAFLLPICQLDLDAEADFGALCWKWQNSWSSSSQKTVEQRPPSHLLSFHTYPCTPNGNTWFVLYMKQTHINKQMY